MPHIEIVSKINVKVDLAFDEWFQEVDKGLKNLVDKTAIDISVGSQQKVPKLTTAAQQSHYVVTEDGSGLDAALAAARNVKPEVQLFETDGLEPRHLQAFVVVAVVYGIILEMGGVNSRNGSRPFLIPTVEEMRPKFLEGAAQILRNAKGIR